MSGATLIQLHRPDRGRLKGEIGLPRSFGKRVVPGRHAACGAMPPRDVAVGVRDLRERIGAGPEPAARLPLAVRGGVIVGLSAALWYGGYELVAVLLYRLADLL
jgi:hypothetical protein